MSVLIKQATLLSAKSPYHLKKRDILIKNGIIEKIANNIRDKANKTLKADNLFVSLGWIDLFADFCDPGSEHKEDLQSGSRTAAAGGYTHVCLIPNTSPAIDSKAQVEYIVRNSRTEGPKLIPIAAVSKDIEGRQLAEMYDMAKAGARLFGDGKKSIQSAGLVLKALQYLKTIDGTLIQLPDTESISAHGLMHEGIASTRLGMPGIPDIAEHIQIQRDIALCEYAESRIHFTGVSTKKSIELIHQARKRGVRVSCSVTPYHLLFTDSNLENYDTNYKVFPPLRSETDRNFLIKAIKEGLIDAIASHHFPQDADAKNVEFAYAKDGMISLQLMLPLLLRAGLQPEEIVNLTTGGYKLLGQSENLITEGSSANLTLFTTSEDTIFDNANNLSLSANTPLLGSTLSGKIIGTILGKSINLA